MHFLLMFSCYVFFLQILCILRGLNGFDPFNMRGFYNKLIRDVSVCFLVLTQLLLRSLTIFNSTLFGNFTYAREWTKQQVAETSYFFE